VRPAILGGDGLSLLVVGDGTSTVHQLPEEGTVVIGRSEKAEVRIDDPSISRRHAKLTIGETLTLEDLGSANGTLVRSSALQPGEPVEITPGVAVEVGATVVIVQGRQRQARTPRPRGRSARPRRIGTHGYFEVRLEEACTNADQTGEPFAVLRLHVVESVSSATLLDVLVGIIRPADPIASYGPGEYEVILIDTLEAEARQIAEDLEDQFTGRGVRVRTGMACYPNDGRSPETLIEKASASALGLAEDVGDADRPVIVQDRVMVRLHRLIERVAAGHINVLLLGETGVGKEILAAAVHKHSRRSEAAFVKMNCAAMTESLFESELFGHEKGAFTGAIGKKKGLLEAANGGTFFLDEVGEMPLSIQAKVLTVIEDRRVLPVGGLEHRELDVRFVAATNRDLEEEVSRGNFRQDLYYRLNGVSLVIPPLRERVTEIEGLARVFITAAVRQLGMTTVPDLSEEALNVLESYTWPGNIRELRNILERAALLCTGDTIEPEHFPLEKMEATILSRSDRPARTLTPTKPERSVPEREPTGPLWTTPAEMSASDIEAETAIPSFTTKKIPVDAWQGGGENRPTIGAPARRRGVPPEGTPEWDVERQRIMDALELCAGNQSEAAKVLNMSRRTLVSRLVTFRIPRPRKPLPGGG